MEKVPFCFVSCQQKKNCSVRHRTTMMANQVEREFFPCFVRVGPYAQSSVTASMLPETHCRRTVLAVLPIKRDNQRGRFIQVIFSVCSVGKTKVLVALLREHDNRPILSLHCKLLRQGAQYNISKTSGIWIQFS